MSNDWMYLDDNLLDICKGSGRSRVLGQPTDVSAESRDELKLYSSMQVKLVFRDKEQSETDCSTRVISLCGINDILRARHRCLQGWMLRRLLQICPVFGCDKASICIK
jgi:hypothetical protein